MSSYEYQHTSDYEYYLLVQKTWGVTRKRWLVISQRKESK